MLGRRSQERQMRSSSKGAQAAEPTPPSSAAKKKRGRPSKMTSESKVPKAPAKKRGKKTPLAEQSESDVNVNPPAMTAQEGASTSAELSVKQADSNDHSFYGNIMAHIITE